ncbi:hypothetical protein [Microbulbifer discodermiae]|uniref:hypothetical protein n=1 Tax=Microbulbifer sp. 2201CG32-9 TaxID=3232309 RepID=UPI00345C1801
MKNNLYPALSISLVVSILLGNPVNASSLGWHNFFDEWLDHYLGQFGYIAEGASGGCVSTEFGRQFGISSVPAYTGHQYQSNFCKYIEFEAPNGGSIEIYAQNKITDEQMIRAYQILEFYLEDVKFSRYGRHKWKVANAMAGNRAKLLLMNGSDDGNNPLPDEMDGQPLYETELIIEGSPAYINNDYENHRDASFEEILHLVHDYGIGTSGEDAPEGALPKYTAAIDMAMEDAFSNFRWPTEEGYEILKEFFEELREEGSLSQEYLASVVDSYYGYWGAYSEAPGGMYGFYVAKTRKDVIELDPMGGELVKEFLSPYVTYMARIDKSFEGTFSLSFNVDTPYTHKSQYLINAQLTGNLDSNLMGNEQDNILIGNSGTNQLNGLGGEDTAVFQGDIDEYSIYSSGRDIFICDTKNDRDGISQLINIEMVVFNDELFVFYGNSILEAEEACERGLINCKGMDIIWKKYISLSM